MDELDLLKKDWQKDDKSYPKLTYNEIYKMILKKSSSIVKWLFIISLLEFAFWIIISLIMKSYDFSDKVKDLESSVFFKIAAIVSYIVLLYFFYLFYKNYKRISTTDNAKSLIESILKTRKTVKQYVIFNLASVVVATLVGMSYIVEHDPKLSSQIDLASANGDMFKFYATYIIATIIILAITIGILLLFYWLVYGILLKRLNRNYKELKKLEV